MRNSVSLAVWHTAYALAEASITGAKVITNILTSHPPTVILEIFEGVKNFLFPDINWPEYANKIRTLEKWLVHVVLSILVSCA